MLKLQTKDNNCGQSLRDCGADLTQIDNLHRDLTNIANTPLKDLVARNEALLIFPKDFSANEDIDTKTILDMQGPISQPENIKIITHNMMGFIGAGNTEIKIRSRFETGEEDFLLYYLLQKVCAINLFDLKFSSEDEVFDFLLYLFPQFLNKAISQGMFRTYKTFKKNDAKTKGPVDISRHIKENNPFRGTIAYTCREFSVDNYLTELVRHTIETIKLKKNGRIILSNNARTRENINTVMSATPTYNKRQKDFIIRQNIKPLNHPYFTAYRYLQKLCLAILRHKKLQYGNQSDKIYGILFDGAWLWEEYLAIELKELGFTHAQNKIGTNWINLWLYNKRFPDFYKGKQEKKSSVQDIPETNFILDAKYKGLQNNGISREDAHQIVTYMHILPSKYGGIIYPGTQNSTREIYGLGGYFYTFGLEIPSNTVDYHDFCTRMKESEEQLKDLIIKKQILNTSI